MVSRKDQLNAYTFARKRTVAAFLQPTPARSEEGAPRPLRAIVPSIVVGTLILVGFGAWGIIRPTAPKGWDSPGKNVIVADKSTTRYVVLRNEDGEPQLHPVLNLASARLLLDPDDGFPVIKVKESVLDNEGPPHGATIGIPYAPDRLPAPEEAGDAKTWAVCLQPNRGGNAASSNRTVFVLDDKDKSAVEGRNRLKGSQALYVQGPDGVRHLIDAAGTRYRIGTEESESRAGYMDLLLRVLFQEGARPQPVSQDWLQTFNEGAPLVFPELDDMGEQTDIERMPSHAGRVGTVIEVPISQTTQRYVVLKDRVAPVSELVSELLMRQRAAEELYVGTPVAVQLSTQVLTGAVDDDWFYGDRDWPEELPDQVNDTADSDGRDVACGVYHGRTSAQGEHELSVWAGTDTPRPVVPGSGTYITPGSGLLFRQVEGTATQTGATYLLTDTGLKYGIQINRDSSAAKARRKQKEQQDGEAQTRLGYGDVRPVPVPEAWADFLSKGPTLDTAGAGRPQGT